MKKNILGVSALAVALIMSAFTLPTRFAGPNWEFTGSDPFNNAHYTSIGSTMPSCLNGVDVCYITAPELVVSGVPQNKPNLSATVTVQGQQRTISQRITEALDFGTANESAKLEP